jgi:hypothetical protein
VVHVETGRSIVIGVIRRFWSNTKFLAVPNALTLTLKDKMNCSAILALYLAVVDDFNTWWVVVYGRVTWDWKADGDRKKYCDWSDTKVLE